MVEVEHCGACLHWNDDGIMQSTGTCKIDGVDRNLASYCAFTPSRFEENMKSMTERYPGYDFSAVRYSRYVMSMLPWQRVAAGQSKVVMAGGVPLVVSANPPLVTNNPQQEFET